MTISTDQLQNMMGAKLSDMEGNKIGKVEEIYLDRASGDPEWIATRTGLLGTHLRFVPIADASFDGDNNVRVIFSEDKVKSSPELESDGTLSPAQEDELYRFYEMTAYEGGTESDETVTPSGHDTSGPTTDDAMTRSEEELHVGTQTRESGRARLHKFIVTEEQTVTIPVQHEEVRMVTEPITDENRAAANAGPAISEEDHEVILHEQVPVVSIETVAKERVTLGTETVTEQQEVTSEVRKERIEMQGDND